MPVDPLGILKPQNSTSTATADPLGILKKKSGTSIGTTQSDISSIGSNGHSDSWNKMQSEMAKKAADAGLPHFDNGNDRLNDAIKRSEKAGYSFNHFTNNNDPTGDRTVSIDIENLTKALQKRLSAEPDPASRNAISKELNYWQSELKDGMTAAEWKAQTGEADPIPQPLNPFLNAKKPTGLISNEQVNAANQQFQSAKTNTTEQNISTDIGQRQSQSTQEKKRSDVVSAATNTANLYFKNNPALFDNVKKNDISLKNIPTEEKDQYSLKNLKNTSAFQRKVGELMNAYDNGELTTYKTATGEDRLGRTMGGWDNFTSGLKEAWNAKGEANKILSMSKEDFIKHTNEQLKNDESYLPVKPNQSSAAYNIGGSVPMALKGIAGAAVGGTMALAAPETMGLSTTALPALTAWLATVPDMAEQAKANALVDYYHRYKQENPNASDDEAYYHAQHASDLAGSEALLTGTALNFIGESGLPANTGQGLWKATGQWLKNQPQSVIAATGIAAGSSGLKDVALQKEGFHVTPQEMLDNANSQGGSMFTMQLAFNLGFGALGAPKYLKSQALEVLSKANPETVQKLSEQAINNGWISQEKIEKGLNDLTQYQKIRQTLPESLDEDKAAAVTGLLQKNDNLEQEKKAQNKILHDDIDAEIDANETKAKTILNSSQPLKHEVDQLTGERGQDIGGRPTTQEAEAKAETLPASENNEAGNTGNGFVSSTETGKTEKGVGTPLQSQQEKIAGIEKRRDELPEEQSNTRTDDTRKILDYFSEVTGRPKYIGDLKSGDYISWLGDDKLGYDVKYALNSPRKAFDIITKHSKELAALEKQPQQENIPNSVVEGSGENIAEKQALNPDKHGDVYTTKQPAHWDAQLSYERHKKDVPNYIYLTHVDNPSNEASYYGHETASPSNEVKILKNVGELKDFRENEDSYLDAGRLEAIRVDYAKEHGLNPNNVEYHLSKSNKLLDNGNIRNTESNIGTRNQSVGEPNKNTSTVSEGQGTNGKPNSESTAKPKTNSVVEDKGSISKEDFHNNILQMAEGMKDSNFDWRLTIPEMSQKDREKAVKDIRAGKESVQAKKLQAYIDNAYDKNIITLNRGRGNNAETVDFPLKEWFGEPLDHKEIEAALKSLDDNTTEIINDEGINSNNIDNLKHLFNGFPYTEKDFNEVKNYLARQDKSNAENQSIGKQSETKNINSQPLNTEQDAIYQSSAAEKMLRPESEEAERNVGLRRMEQVNEPKEPSTTQKEKPPISNENKEEVDIHAERPPTVLTHRGLQEIATEIGGEDITPRERETRLQQLKDANDEIDKWKNDGTYGKNIKELIGRAKEGKIDEVEQKILANHLATLREQFHKIKDISSPEFRKKFDEIEEVKNAAQIMRSKAGGLLGDKPIGIPDDTLEGFLAQEKDVNKGAELTDNQIITAVNEYEKIKAANEEYQQKFEDLQAKYAKLLAERELKKTQASTPKNTKKTHEDFVKERTSLVEKLKKQKEEQEKFLEERGIHKAGFGITLTTDMVKTIKDIVKSHIEEVGQKLEDVIDKVHAQLKDVFPEIEKKDIHDVIAGVYNEKKKTRSEVAERMQNLRIQAQLINKYEALLKGEEPKNEKSKIKRNQEIHDLREKIAGLKKENIEANKFYGEGEGGNKKIEKLEDELQRLRERRPKERTEKEQREISQREKELKEQIAAERKTIAAEEKEASTRYVENVPDEIKKLQAIKTRNENELKKINEQLMTGDFEPPKKKTPLSQNDEFKKNFPQAYKETIASQTKLIKAKQERQIRMARQQFANMTKRQKFAKNAIRYLNVPRTLMASWDFSAPLRQAAVVTASHPRMAAKSFATMFKHAFSQTEFDRYYHELKESPKWQLYQDSKLAITDPHDLHLNKQEEAYLGGNIAEKIPIIGKGVKASERAYVSYLNKMRIDLFDRFVDLFEEQGKTFSNSPDLYKGLATYINNATGRGSLGFADAAAPLLNSALFSPRLIASRMNMLGIPDLVTFGYKGFYTALPKEIRVMAIKDMLKFIGAGVSVLALAKYGFGAQVETDPRSSDFGKIKSGNTRWDLWGGFQPYVRVIAQIATGQRKTGALGVNDIDKRFGENRLTPFWSFARGKLAPIPSIGIDIIGGGTLVGQKIERRFDIPFDKNDNPKGNNITLTDVAINHLFPLLATDVYDAMKDRGISSLFTVGIPSTFGVGTQTYPPYVAKQRTGRPQPPRRTHRVEPSPN